MYKKNTMLIPLNELFESKRGNSKYTKAYCNKNRGEYEVYTGTTIGSFGKIKTYEYDTPNLTYTTDGEYAGTLSVLEGKYNVGGHRALLIPRKENIVLQYFKYILYPIFILKKRSNCVPTLTWQIIKDLRVPVPINEDGTLNIEEQIESSNKYKTIEKRKQILLEDKDRLINSSIDFNLSNYKYINVTIESIFDLSQPTNCSKFTKGFIKENPGDIPVYGATKIADEVGYGYVKDNAEIIEIKNGRTVVSKVKYFQDCLTYNIDGTAGYIFYRTGRFSLSEKVRPLIILDEYKDKLEPEYLKYILQPIFRRNVKGRKGPNGENEFSKLSKNIIKDLFVQIPVGEDGEFNLQAQKEIAKKYKQLEEIKKLIVNQIDNVLDVGLITEI